MALVVPILLGADGPRFRDVAREAGVTFTFDTGSRGKHDLPEIMGGGVALIDADGDGRLDLFFANGGPLAPAPGQLDPPCRLYRNEGAWRFRDITDQAHAPGPSYAMGAAVADYDNDGRDDLFVSGWRDQRLYRNLGGGRFQDTTRHAGLESASWGTSAAFADLDADGDADLVVASYVEFDPARAPYCAAPDARRDFCGPEEFSPQPDRLYRNNGDGTFTELAREAGLADPEGRGLGVLVADLAGDPRPDIFVANDGSPSRLYENLGGMRFREVGGRLGVALDGQGEALAGMGTACGDLDGDGLADLLVSNFYRRGTVAFAREGPNAYRDASALLGLTAATRPVLGFGLGLEDFDGDGDLDLIQANGHVLDRARLGEPFAMPTSYLRNDSGLFRPAPDEAGPSFDRPILGRGVAVGDLDGDGRPDAVIARLDGPPAVLRNLSPKARFATVVLKTKGTAAGATVRAQIGGRSAVRTVVGGGSYLSASSPALALGLGSDALGRIDVRWPSGRHEIFSPKAGSIPIVLEEGRGSPAPGQSP